MSKRNLIERFHAYLIPVSASILVLIATQVTVANLPSNKLFAGHDSGFYTLFPAQLIRTSAGTWEVKTALGFVNFQALVTLPFALLVMLVNALSASGALVVRFFYELQLLLCEFGTFGIAWLVLGRFFTDTPPIARALAALAASLIGTFNIFTAVLLLYPPSNFQMGVFIWPVVFSAELYLLWRRPTLPVAILFGILLTLATLGNPAHTMLGLTVVLAVYVVNSIATKDWHWLAATAVVVVMFSSSIFFWLPAFASTVLYHGNVAAPVGVSSSALSTSAELIKQRTAIGSLLRFDGLLWWPKTRNAPLYDSAFMVVATYVPALLAIVALLSRHWITRACWVLLLIGIELGKGAHEPFQLNLVPLMASMPVLAAFRQTYDKFALYIMIALPLLAAIGLIVLWRTQRFARAGMLAFVLIVLSCWPFLVGRIADPYFLTNIPNDYRIVDRMMGHDPQARVLSFPGGSNEIHVTDWFKGGNFENLLFRTHAVNSAIFKQRSISAAPLYDDFDLIAARELPQLVGLLGIYDVQYVLLHKDYLTSYRMAFDFERYHVLGPLLARAAKRILDADPRLRRLYDGPSLSLYRVSNSATLPHAFGTYRAGWAMTYENALFGLVDAGIMDASQHPDILFLGNQASSTENQQALRDAFQRTAYTVHAPLVPETPNLYREQYSISPEAVQAFMQLNQADHKKNYLIFVQPHGDWLTGALPPNDNVNGAFDVNRLEESDVRMRVSAERNPKRAFDSFIGTDGERPWPLSNFANEPPASAIITEGDLLDSEAAFRGREPLTDPSTGVLKGDFRTARAITTVISDRSSATYVMRLKENRDTEELVVARRPIPPLLLQNDPRITFDYEMSDPKMQAAWLRFEFVGPQRERVFLDKQLDEVGHLENFNIRDNLQAGLDNRFDRLSALYQNDPLWVASQRLYGAPQADKFRLIGFHLILGKRPLEDLARSPVDVAFRFRGLQVVLNNPDPPTYATAGYHVDFARTKLATSSRGIEEVTTTRKSGAIFFSASAAPGTMNAAVSVTIRTPQVDVTRYPSLVLRYRQPVQTEELIVKLGFVNAPIKEVAAGLDVPPNALADTQPPSAWIKSANFTNQSEAIALDTLAAPESGSWQKLTCDVRRIAAYRANALHARLSYVTIEFRERPPALGDAFTALSNLVFALGDLSLIGSGAVPSALESAPLDIDGRPMHPQQVTPVDGARDELSIRLGVTKLRRGHHRIATHLPIPWSVGSVTIVPHDLPPMNRPRVTIRHIDDELFAVHVDRTAPMWLAFAETYHPGWRLIQAQPPRNRLEWVASLLWLRRPVSDHVVGNAFNNTWFVKGTGSADYVLDFAPQDFAFIAKSLTVLAILTALGFAVYLQRR